MKSGAFQNVAFKPGTPRGKTQLEARNQGPLHPDKTEQDYTAPGERPRVQAWQARSSAKSVAVAT